MLLQDLKFSGLFLPLKFYELNFTFQCLLSLGPGLFFIIFIVKKVKYIEITLL